ncbi:Threonine efflux protein [Mycobacteroides abscessus subsp. abscessus]|nr:Threonine efflux protein [Mycobacteroides abscessus subsp. abscessus]
MAVESWATFTLALLVALAVPGPDLVLVVHAASRGVREATSTAAGIVTGLMLHALLAVAGATALLVSAPGALTVVQGLGAGVLLWMGGSMLRAARSAEPDAQPETGRRTAGGLRARARHERDQSESTAVFRSDPAAVHRTWRQR